ncbi:hypothetical protein RUM43_008251 [Polyplax serrata]|uniref:Uncharacterized protein n=1 Tax=Polyplax serrata TaxID=468196 RepID=A0AAN8P720_POLSC
MSKFVDLLTQYIDNLQVEGNYATGQIDTDEKYADFRTALRNFGYSFTIRSSRKETCSGDGLNFRCKTDGSKDKDGDNTTGKKEKRLPGRGSLMFKSSSDVSVPFFGSPFTVETTIYFTCSQGIKYYGSKQYPDEMFREGDPLSKKRRRPKLTKKIGCQARMTVKKIKVFPSESYLVSRDNWREKKVAIDQLKNDYINNKPIKSINRYCIVISLDISHNHEAKIKPPKRPKQSQFDPARKVLKLHEQFQEALVMLNSELITKCTNISILTGCCNSLKGIINQLKDSIEKADGVPIDLITAAIDKITQKQLRSAAILEKKNQAAKKKQMKTDKLIKAEPTEQEATNTTTSKMENNENNQIIELSNIIEGTQVIWDPVNVSWVQDGQILVQDASSATSTAASNSTTRPIKDTQSILVQHRPDEVPITNTVSDQNIGVITQGGQNYTILQHGTNVHLPNIGVSVPFTMAKVVHPTTILASNVKKTSKRNDVGVTAIAIPAGVEWNQQNWGQITQVVGSEGQFASFPTQTIWNISH